MWNVCVGELQVISDVLIYTNHTDPQLRGNTALVIGRFVRAVLGEGRGSWDNWMAMLQPAMMCSMLTLFEHVFPIYILYDGYFCGHYTLWLIVWLLRCCLCQELLCAFYCHNCGSFNSLDHSSLVIIVMYLMIIYLLVLRLLLLNLLQWTAVFLMNNQNTTDHLYWLACLVHLSLMPEFVYFFKNVVKNQLWSLLIAFDIMSWFLADLSACSVIGC